jgi:hypothetical protein
LDLEIRSGVHIFERGERKITHFVTMTLWTNMDAITRFPGNDVEKAKYYSEEEDYLLEFEPTVVHYEVVGHS